MNIKNTVRLEWSVEDPVYPYQNSFEYTVEEFQSLDLAAVRAQQESEYMEWLNTFKAIEQEQQ